MLTGESIIKHSTLRTVFPLLYLTERIRDADEDMLHTGRVLYLADKHHLLHYGRTVTRDEYIYIQGGPIGKTALDLSEGWRESLGRFYRNKFSRTDIDDHLSQTDREALDFVVATFADMPHGKFYEYIRSLPEWKKVEDLFQLKDDEGKPRIRFLPVDTRDLLRLPDGDRYFNVSAEHIEMSRQMMLTGELD